MRKLLVLLAFFLSGFYSTLNASEEGGTAPGLCLAPRPLPTLASGLVAADLHELAEKGKVTKEGVVWTMTSSILLPMNVVCKNLQQELVSQPNLNEILITPFSRTLVYDNGVVKDHVKVSFSRAPSPRFEGETDENFMYLTIISRPPLVDSAFLITDGHAESLGYSFG